MMGKIREFREFSEIRENKEFRGYCVGVGAKLPYFTKFLNKTPRYATQKNKERKVVAPYLKITIISVS